MSIKIWKFKIRYDNWFKWYCTQVSTPYVSLYKDCDTLALNFGIIIGELQFWYGNIEDLLD